MAENNPDQSIISDIDGSLAELEENQPDGRVYDSPDGKIIREINEIGAENASIPPKEIIENDSRPEGAVEEIDEKDLVLCTKGKGIPLFGLHGDSIIYLFSPETNPDLLRKITNRLANGMDNNFEFKVVGDNKSEIENIIKSEKHYAVKDSPYLYHLVFNNQNQE